MSEEAKQIFLSPYYFDNATFYKGPKHVIVRHSKSCPGMKVPFHELQMHLCLNGIQSACPKCKKTIDYTDILNAIETDFPIQICECDKLCLIKYSKDNNRPYASCILRMGKKDRCTFFHFFED